VTIKTKNREIRDDFSFDEQSTKVRTFNPSEYESKEIASQLPMTWHKAKGFNVFDEDGNKWIDLTSGIFAMNVGHSNPVVNNAIKEQLDSDLVFSFLYPTEIRKEFAKKLLDISPEHFEKMVILNTGSEATDIAYKIIKKWAKKNNKKHIISFEGSYHGRVLSSDLVCGTKDSSDWSNVVDDDVCFVKFPYEEDTQFDPRELPAPDQIAAFFLETYQGWGAWMYPDKYINDLYAFAKKHNILICFDEIQAGMYRMGELYGYQTYGEHIKPDIICLAKALSAPLPMSVVLSTSELIDDTSKLGGTHAGNPLCCAASMANIDLMSEESFQIELKEKCAVFENRLKDLEKYSTIKTVNVRGMIAGLIFNNADDANKVVVECVHNGVMPVNTWSVSIKIGPPLTISLDALNEALDVIENSVRRISE